MSIGDASQSSQPGLKRRLPTWGDLRNIFTFKTFYLILVVALMGIMLIFSDSFFFPPSTPATGTSPSVQASHWKGILLALGATLLTSSTVSIMFELFVRLDLVDFVSERITNTLSSVAAASATFTRSGLKNFENNRALLDFNSIAKSADGYLKVIGFSANDILSPQIMHFLTDRLRSEREFFVQVLILNPWCVMAQRRADANAYDGQYKFVRSVWTALHQLLDLGHTLRANGIGKDRFDARIYDDIPSLSMVIDDSKAIVTPILCVLTGGSSPSFIVEKTQSSECSYAQYQKHFDKVWNDARSIVDTSLDNLFLVTLEEDNARLMNLPTDIKEWTESKLIPRF